MKKYPDIKVLNKDLVRLISSGYFTQFISLLLLPILVRLYQPKDFGDFSMYVAISSGIGSLASLRYELAFFSANNTAKFTSVFNLCLILAFLMPAVFLFILFLVALLVPDLRSFISNNFIVCYIGGILLSLQMIFLTWNNSKGQYKKISLSRIVQSLLVSCLPIILYPLKLGSQALIYAQIFSLIASVILLSKTIDFKFSTIQRVVWVFRKFYKNSMIGVPHILFDVVGTIALNTATLKYYGADVLGYFNIAQRFKNIVNTIGVSYGILFNEKIAKLKGNEFPIKIGHLKSLILPMLLIYFGFQFLDGLIITLFGQKWAVAIEMAKILSPQFIITSIIAAFGSYFYIKHKQILGATLGFSVMIANIVAVIIPTDTFIHSANLSVSLAVNMLIMTMPILLVHIIFILKAK